MAVSSESYAHKALRFSQISDLFKNDNTFSVHEIGMGLAAFNGFIKQKFPEKQIEYSGTDILPEYVSEAEKLYPECKFYLRDVAEKAYPDKYDYVIMSGVFHQKRESTIPVWEGFWQEIIKNSFSMCNKGIAFNFISPFVEYYTLDAYFCNIHKLLMFINESLSRYFSIQHNYALYEFTVFVYKEELIKELYPQQEFAKYFKI